MPPFKIRVAGEDGRPVRPGVTGECQIYRRGLSPHYWKDKGTDEELLTADGWLRTGDLATRNRLGLIRLVGRMKDVIKSGGYSVYVRELEEAIMAHPAVARAAAFGLPHKDKGEIPAAAVELHHGSIVTESSPARILPAEPRSLQSPAPHLDSRRHRLPPQPHRQAPPPRTPRAVCCRDWLTRAQFASAMSSILPNTPRGGVGWGVAKLF